MWRIISSWLPIAAASRPTEWKKESASSLVGGNSREYLDDLGGKRIFPWFFKSCYLFQASPCLTHSAMRRLEALQDGEWGHRDLNAHLWICRWSPGLGIKGLMGRWEPTSWNHALWDSAWGGPTGDEVPHCNSEDQPLAFPALSPGRWRTC